MAEVTFLGDAPESGGNIFSGVTATAYYPANNSTWTEDVMQQYGGKITWVAYEIDENVDDDGGIDENVDDDGSIDENVDNDGSIDENVDDDGNTDENVDDDDDDQGADTNNVVLGDVNLDGYINYLDAMTALRFDAELIDLSDEQLVAGDVNNDGSVDSLDAILILRYDAGLIGSFE